MTAWINGLLVVLIMLITAFTVTMTAMIFEPRPQPVRLDLGTITIQEDDPRWDCRTMGNRVCGAEVRP